MRLESSKIVLSKMKFYAFHGVMPQESVVGHTFVVDMELQTDNSVSLDSDDLNDTVSYADLYELVRAEMEVPSKLLEHLAGRIGKAVFGKYPKSEKLKVRIMKLTPPMGADAEGCGVELDFINN